MSYLALYRKLRPDTFSKVIGQQHIVKTLKNQIINDRVAHSYLFCGTRGTGKTSVAKIFAKALNCENSNKTGEPCGTCDICIEIARGSSLNVIEIDAASNNSVDDIRELREQVKYSPPIGNYKVYIIDEVHMLSIGAFNALLKTLEEPPSYVVFILATTDPQKIPVTILSRCQRFDFRRIIIEDMFNILKIYSKDENIVISDDAVKYICKISDGAMRDALSILDQCSAFYSDEEITLQKALDITGSVDNQVFFDMTEALIDLSSNRCLEIIDDIIYKGRDISQFVSEIIEHFRNVLVSLSVQEKDLVNILNITLHESKKIKIQSEKGNKDIFISLIKNFSDLQRQLKTGVNSKILLEIECIKFCNTISEKDLSDVFNKIKLLEKKLEDSENKVVYVEKNMNILTENVEETPLRELAINQDIKNVIKNWKNTLAKLEPMLFSFFSKMEIGNLEDQFLYLYGDKEININFVAKKVDVLKEILGNQYNKSFEIIVISKDDFVARKRKIQKSQPKDVSKIVIESFEKTIQNIKETLDIDIQIND